MPEWLHKIHIRDIIDEKTDAESINKKKVTVAARLEGFAADLPEDSALRWEFERLAEDFRAIPEEDNLRPFNFELECLYGICDAYLVWVKLKAGE